MKIISLFSGAGGLDKGFEKAGMDVVWANEFDKKIHETYQYNFPETTLNTEDIRKVKISEIPECDGIIGGPPCQSWSNAGARRGINDKRGLLFNTYCEIINEKSPKFFLAENVPGMLMKRNLQATSEIIKEFKQMGYNTAVFELNAFDYGVPQSRKRVFFIGYQKGFGKVFELPKKPKVRKVLKDVIWDYRDNAVPALDKNRANIDLKIPNHEFMIGGFSYIYMSRNRRKDWSEPSFTIQAAGRHAPCHPDSSEMVWKEKDKFEFAGNKYRRLTVRECALIQTFDSDHVFFYDSVNEGYKMVGNAVPVDLAFHIAKQINHDLYKARRYKRNMIRDLSYDTSYGDKQLNFNI